jgi:hypothetical protein
LHGLATAGAFLACFAVVLNIGPFTGALSGKATRAVSDLSVGPASVSEPAAEPYAELALAEAKVELVQVSAPGASTIEPSPVSQTISELPEAQPANGEAQNADAIKKAHYVGVWAPDEGTCSARNFREGLLPAVISMDGASAGETFCIFNNQKQVGSSWRVAATCSNAREQWTANVRLTVKGNRLTWSSKRGTQVYTRCATDVVMAEAR